MNKATTALASFGLGLGCMYLCDPTYGRRRRAILRDKGRSFLVQSEDLLDKGVRDLAHRAVGCVAEARSRLAGEACPDEVLVARVRSQMGRFVSHPHAIQVKARDGHVQLDGQVLAAEADDVVEAVSGVRGVRSVESCLEVHKTSEDIPALQGGITARQRQQLARENWPPAFRLLASIGGGAAALYGLRRRGVLGLAADIAGAWLLLRGLSNLHQTRLVGIGAGRRAIDIHKTISINAPIDQVFGFWTHVENFPRFMRHVREVRDLGYGRTHWIVEGPAGVSIQWNATTTRLIPNRLVCWKTEPGAAIAHAGAIRFDPTPNGGTRVDIRMSYNPLAGALGHLIASIFGQDPKHAMDDDMVRFKSLLELGKATGHETVARDQLAAAQSQATEPHVVQVQP